MVAFLLGVVFQLSVAILAQAVFAQALLLAPFKPVPVYGLWRNGVHQGRPAKLEH